MMLSDFASNSAKLGMGLLLFALFFLSSPCQAANNDLWDVSQGTTVIKSSPVLYANSKWFSNAANMLGGRGGAGPADLTQYTIFKDGIRGRYKHFIVFQTRQVVTVDTIDLLLISDADSGKRAVRQVTLWSNPDGQGWKKIYSSGPLSPYRGKKRIRAKVHLLSARQFKAEFEQMGPTGPRIAEIDAYGEKGYRAPITGHSSPVQTDRPPPPPINGASSPFDSGKDPKLSSEAGGVTILATLILLLLAGLTNGLMALINAAAADAAQNVAERTAAGVDSRDNIADSTDNEDDGPGYQDPAWSLRNNPDPSRYDWDENSGSWRDKDELHAERMMQQGYAFDPHLNAWRKPPEMPELEEVPNTEGYRYRPELQPGSGDGDYVSDSEGLVQRGIDKFHHHWGYEVTPGQLDSDLNNLEALERNALNEHGRLNDQIAQAEAYGDKWLAERLTEHRDNLRNHIGNIQNQKNNIINAVNSNNQQVADFNDKITKPGFSGHAAQALTDGKDIAAALWNDPSLITKDPAFVEDVQRGIEAAERVRKGEGVELRPGVFGYDTERTGPSIAEQFEGAVRNVKDLEDQLDEAQVSGDEEAIERLTRELNGAKDEARRLSGELQQHERNVKDWQFRSANANIALTRKGAEIAGEVMSVPGSARSVTNFIDDFNRGQGVFHRSIKHTDDGLDMDMDLDGPNVRRPTMTQAELDLDAEFYANTRIGKERADDVLRVLNDPDADDIETAEVINRALESRNAKIRLNGQSDEINEKFYNAVMENRTQPLFDETAESLNNIKTSDGQNRFYVENSDTKLERNVQGGDFSPISGPKARPNTGQDLDFDNPVENQIMDRTTGKPATPEVINGAIDQACERLNINRRAQEINYTHSLEPESYRLRPGQTPKEHIAGASDFDNFEARHAKDITDYKVEHARKNYETDAEHLAEGSRATTKELNRVVDRMMADPKHAEAELPGYFQNRTAIPKEDGEYKTVLEVLSDVGNDRLPTGTGQAAIREACGRNLPEVQADIANLPESIIKLRPSS